LSVICDVKFAVWRIVIGLALIPAFGTLYQRLTLPESTRYIASQKRPNDEETFAKLQAVTEDTKTMATATELDADDKSPVKETLEEPQEVVQKKAHFSGKRPCGYFSRTHECNCLQNS
jgi:MFS transporter, PHS family, inorganic phosphate transporter